MDSLETCHRKNQSPDAVLNSEEIPDNFFCCICLGLLYKPVVLHCGHISCFWCVHQSMSSRDESRCPICRNPYTHFPAICQMLHFLLLKLYPITYKEREDQIRAEECRTGYFSPEFNGRACESETDGEFSFLGGPAHSSAECFKSSSYSDSHSTSIDKLCKTVGQVESHDNGTTHTKQNSDGDLNQIKPITCKENEQASVADLLCTACKQLLFRPVVLNCGHVYCQTCIIIPADKMLRCQVCRCVHPRSFPKVCLTLDQFLATKFPKEYALRREAVQLKQVSSKDERATTCSLEAGKQDLSPFQLVSRDHLPFSVAGYMHIGVGCDACGMSPIIGDRYKCKDCTEKIGFDLCGDCYISRPKLPGRFNQRHTPEHKFEFIKGNIVQRWRLENGSTSVVISDDASENMENGPVRRNLSGDSRDNIP